MAFACQWSTSTPKGHEGAPSMSLHATEAEAEAAAAIAARLHQHVVVFELDEPDETRAMLARAFERRGA